MTGSLNPASGSDPTAPGLAFLDGGGEMGACIRAHDWSATPLGPPLSWPQALKTTVRMALATRHPIFIFWGERHVCIYNDGYRPSLGPEKHPSMLGMDGREAWPEIWDVIGPQIEQVMRGEGATWHENQLIPILRDGAIRDMYWTYSYGPIDDETAPNGVGGALVLVTDTTSQVMTERRHFAEFDRLRSLVEQAPGFMAVMNGPDHVLDLVNAAYMQLVGARDVLGRSVREALPEVVDQGYIELIDRVFTTGEVYVGTRQPVSLSRTPGDPPEQRFVDFVYQPIRDAQGTVTGIFLDGVDVTESCRIEAALLATQARQELMLSLLQQQRETGDPDEMMRRASEAVATYLGAHRAGFLETASEDSFTVGVQWNDGTLPALQGTFPVGSLGAAYVAEIRKGRTLGTDDLATDPLTRESRLPEAQVRATIGSPIFRDGAWRGGLFVHHATVRHWTEDEITLVRDVANQTWDAVERARAVAALAEGEDFLRLLLNSTTEAFYSVDPSGVTTLCNDAFLKMLGFADEADVIGRRLHEMIHHSHPDGSHYDAADCPIYLAALGGKAAQVADEVFFRQDGSSFPVEYRAAPIRQDGKVTGAICTFVDITERKQAETALRTLNETLEARVEAQAAERDRLWRNSQDLQVVIDRHGVFQAVNPAATQTLGWAAEEMVGRAMFDFIVLDDVAAAEAAMTHLLHHPLPTFENRYRHKDGGFRWISWVATPEADLIYASGRHVTAQKAAEAQLEATQDALRQSQKMEAVGQLTGGIAHDFNNMLTVVIGSLELLGRRLGDADARARRYINAAMDGSRRAALLTQRLLAFSRQSPLRPEAADPNKLVAGMSDLLRHALGGDVRLEVVLAAGIWRVQVDVNQLESVILNLAVNARDAMPEGGRLTIETQNAHIDARYAAQHPGVPTGQYVLLAVTDTGTGMTPEVAARAFDPFYTTKEVGHGTGLGLSQVYGFVRQSGGHVKIYSEVGHGTTVKVYLPRLIGGVPDLVIEEIAASAMGDRSEVVLVVEDEPAVRRFSVDALTELGYRVLEADGAANALRLLDAHPEISLLFTDVVMPEVNGRKLAEAARQRRPDLRILFTTGYTRNAVVHNGVLDPGVDLIGKPFTMEELAARVRDVLDGPGPGMGR